MANITPNYKLNKPLRNEKVSINVLNQNMDILDEKIDSISDKVDEINPFLTSHVSDAELHVQSQEHTNWNYAYSHSQSAHARTDATKVEKSSTNGNIKINDVETIVYIHPSGTNPHGTTKNDVGLNNVENKSSATIRNEITKENVTDALGYIPSDKEHTHNYAGSSSPSGAATSALSAADDSDFDFGDISK